MLLEPNSAEVPESRLDAIRGTARHIYRYGMVVDIEGHADPSETVPGISLQRARNVVELLIRYGVDPKKLRAVDKGAGPPPEGVESNAGVFFKDTFVPARCRDDPLGQPFRPEK